MADAQEKVVFWLVPAEEERRVFVSLIHDLARRFEAPIFEPHVTLQGGELNTRLATDLLERIANQNAPVQLEITGIEFSDKYTKTLFVQFRPSEAASALSAAIGDAAASGDGYKFDPHLSLLYRQMDAREEEKLACEIKLPFAQVNFDTLQVVRVPAQIKGPADVEAWRTIGKRPLRTDSR